MAGYGMGELGDKVVGAALTGGKKAYDAVNTAGAAVVNTANNMKRDAAAMINKPAPPLVDRRKAEIDKIMGQ